jgi:hypothetical protein
MSGVCYIIDIQDYELKGNWRLNLQKVWQTTYLSCPLATGIIIFLLLKTVAIQA